MAPGDVSPDLVSTVTDAVQQEVAAWQTRPLEPMYPVVFFNALGVKMRGEAVVQTKAVYLAPAILPDGRRDILIAATDGLTGMGEALEAVYPRTTWQTCVVHLIRRSLACANWKERKPVAPPRSGRSTPPAGSAANTTGKTP